MDDHDFDDIIKRKVGEYEQAGFDPQALAAFHRQMDLVAPWPWYSRYRTELIIASGFAISTILILLSQWRFSLADNKVLEDNMTKIKGQQEEIEMLKRQIHGMEMLPPDTIRIIEIREHSPVVNTLLLEQITHLEERLRIMQEADKHNLSSSTMVLLPSRDNDPPTDESFSVPGGMDRVVPRPRSTGSLRATPGDNSFFSGRKNTAALSYRTLRNLEKHYQKGIGIRLGPVIELSKGLYQGGSGRIDIPLGLMADFILSPSLSIETGASFVHRLYELSGTDADAVALPGRDPDLGPVITSDVDSWMLEIPLNIKYRYPLTLRKHIIGSLGYSALAYTRQLFEYDYMFDGNPNLQINSKKIVTGFRQYPGTANISLGMSQRLKNRKLLETSFYYHHGLGGRGAEKINGNFYGVRTSYWFNIR